MLDDRFSVTDDKSIKRNADEKSKLTKNDQSFNIKIILPIFNIFAQFCPLLKLALHIDVTLYSYRFLDSPAKLKTYSEIFSISRACPYKWRIVVCHAANGLPPQVVPWTIYGNFLAVDGPPDQVWLP